MVSEEEDESDETMSKRVEGDYEGVWMDGEDKPTDDIRYNGEGKKIVVLTGSMPKTALKRAIATLARSESKPQYNFAVGNTGQAYRLKSDRPSAILSTKFMT